MSHDPHLLDAWMLDAGRPVDRARAESADWLADGCEAIECSIVASERYARAALAADGVVWRDPQTGALVSHHDALARALADRAKRHADTGAPDPQALALAAARRALVLAAGWTETLAASAMQDAALYVDPLATTPADAARATHTLAVAASIAAKRARAQGRG